MEASYKKVCLMAAQEGKEAVSIVGKGIRHKFHEDAALVASLKICAKQKDLEKGSTIHADLLKRDVLKKDSSVGCTLVNMYAKCGALPKAQQVFDELPVRGLISWTVLITAYARHGDAEKALECFDRMQCEGVSPDAMTFACILKACGSIGAIEKGKEIHAKIVSEDLVGDIVLGNALIYMYVKCCALAAAHKVLDELPALDVISWSTLIAGYAQYGHGVEALTCFEQMQQKGLSPDAVTFACLLKACGSIGAAGKGKEIHSEIVREGLLGRTSVLGSALVCMYLKCGALAQAQQVFDKLPARHLCDWTALIGGYALLGHGDEALNCYELMQLEGLRPDSVTFLCILRACASIGSITKGKEIHAEIVKKGLLRKGSVLGNALVDMYAQCGAIAQAQQVFYDLPVQDVISWTALMAGFAQLGKHDIVFDSFRKMIGENIQPNLVTFTVLLNACSYSGLVDEGQMYFEIMTTSYGIVPTLEHYTCMVDLFSCAGHFHKAMEVIENMPSSDYLPVWSALLGACQKWGIVELGSLAFQHVVRLNKKSTWAYVCMSNIYQDAGMHEDADNVEAIRLKNEAWKKPGRCWWTDAGGDVYSFCVRDKEHSLSESINAKLQDIAHQISQEGYCPNLHRMSQDICNDSKLMFGLL